MFWQNKSYTLGILIVVFMAFMAPASALETLSLNGELSYSPTGTYLLQSNAQGLTVYHAKTHKKLSHIPLASPFAYRVSQNGSRLAVHTLLIPGKHSHYRLYHFPKLELIREFQSTDPEYRPHVFDLSPDGEHLASLSPTGINSEGYFLVGLKIYRKEGLLIQEYPAFKVRNTSAHQQDLQLEFAPQGKYLSVGMGWDLGVKPPVKTKLKVWDLDMQTWVYWLDSKPPFQYASLRPYFLSLSPGSSPHDKWRLRRWDMFENRLRTLELPLDARFYQSIKMSADGQILVLAEAKNQKINIFVYRISPWSQLEEYELKGSLSKLSIHPSRSRLIISQGQDLPALIHGF